LAGHLSPVRCKGLPLACPQFSFHEAFDSLKYRLGHVTLVPSQKLIKWLEKCIWSGSFLPSFICYQLSHRPSVLATPVIWKILMDIWPTLSESLSILSPPPPSQPPNISSSCTSRLKGQALLHSKPFSALPAQGRS